MKPVSAMALDFERCYRAVESRDARFDGWFITAVVTTGIYCRPSCPTPIRPKRANVRFYPTAAAAQLTAVFGEKISAMLIGPGLSHGAGTDEFVAAVLRNAKGVPTVVDADGLNALARTEDWTTLLPPRCVLTPHDGEAARLAGRVVPVGGGRTAFAERHARQWGAVVVLKGAITIVTDGKRTFVHDQPNPTLGVGGSGDVLGGAIAAFLARGLSPLAAACAGVWVHGRAGALLASEIGESGALASDIVDALPRALRQVLSPA